MDALYAYLPEDRLHAIAQGSELPERAYGSALFADISGFTPLAEALTSALGPRAGVDALTDYINAVYTALTSVVAKWHGSVICFSGDAITCWFDAADGPAPVRAAACSLDLQAAMSSFTTLSTARDRSVSLALKVAVASGPVRRFVVGDPALQKIDVLAGATIARMAAGELLARSGEVLLDDATLSVLDLNVAVGEVRQSPTTGERFSLLLDLSAKPNPTPWPEVSAPAEALRPWILPTVWSRYQAGVGAFLTELRPAVVLFLRFDDPDFDADERAGLRLDAFIRRVQTVLAEGGGTLLQLTVGDKGAYLYAAFGAPVAHEDDVRRAAHIALECHAIANELGLPPVQIGISQGALRCGAYGGARRLTYGVLGDEVNLAARLMSRAAPGETLLSGRVQRELGHAFTVAPRAPVALKGKAEPIPVFALLGIFRQRAVRLQEPAYSLPLVGRDGQLARVAEALDQAQAGFGQLLVIEAEAGMGKSRLVAEMVHRAQRRGFVCYGGAATSSGTQTPYLAWRPIFQALLDVNPQAPLRRQLRQLADELEDRVPERAEALPLLGPLLELELPPNEFTNALPPEHSRGAREGLLLALLMQEAHTAHREGGGLVLVIEDAHWLDPLGAALLARLAWDCPHLPVLLLVATRPAELSVYPAPALPNAEILRLDGLDERALTDLVRAKLSQLFPARAGSLPPALVSMLAARAQGNPFFVEELLNYLHDRGVVPDDSTALAQLEFPDSLHRLVMARLDQLGEGERAALRAASVVGRLFHAAWLSAFTPELGELPRVKADLQRLATLDLTALDTPEPELAYLFKHVVTQEVAYASLAQATRYQLHATLARWLEQASPSSPPLDLLAYHYDRSDDLVSRRKYLQLAGEAAVAQGANEVAVDYLGRALALVPAEDRDGRWALYDAREEAYGRLGKREAQARDLDTLALLASGDPIRETQVALRRAAYFFAIAEFAASYDAAHHALALATMTGDLHSQAQAHHDAGGALVRLGDEVRAKAELETGLAITRSDSGRDAKIEAGILLWMTAVAPIRFDQDARRELMSLALQRSYEAGDLAEVAVSLFNLSFYETSKHNFTTARAYLEEARSIYRRLGSYLEARVEGELGYLAFRLGDYTASRQLLTRAVAVLERSESRFHLVIAQSTLAYVFIEEGKPAEALATLQRIASDYELLTLRAAVLDPMAWALVTLGRIAEAEAVCEELLQFYSGLSDQDGVVGVKIELAGVALLMGDLERVRQLIEPVMQFLESSDFGDFTRPMRNYEVCIRALQSLGDPRADRLLTDAYEQLIKQAANLDERERQAFLEAVPSHRAIMELWREAQRSL